MRRLRLALPFAFALAFAFTFSGCFEVEEPLCAFQCGDNNLCPDDYMCLPDGYCHLHGKAGDCQFPDASVSISDGGGDLSIASDGGDMTTVPTDL